MGKGHRFTSNTDFIYKHRSVIAMIIYHHLPISTFFEKDSPTTSYNTLLVTYGCNPHFCLFISQMVMAPFTNHSLNISQNHLIAPQLR